MLHGVAAGEFFLEDFAGQTIGVAGALHHGPARCRFPAHELFRIIRGATLTRRARHWACRRACLSIVAAVLATLLVGIAALWIGANLSTAEKRLLYRPKRLYTSGDPDFRRALGILLGPPLVSGNRVTTLINGDRIFPAMLAAIRAAKTSVTFETFVFRDQIGCEFCEALAAAAQRGVSVCILLDWMGSRGMDANLLEATRKAGCNLQLYHPPTWFHLGRLNNRTHRKVLIVDGAIGFTGGVGMPELDGLASLGIALVLAAAGAALARRTKQLLIGEVAQPELQRSILEIAGRHAGIARANGVLTSQLGADQVVAALSAEFDDRLTTPEIEDCVRSLEEEIRAAHPEVSLLFVKPQTAATWESRRRAIEAGGTDSD